MVAGHMRGGGMASELWMRSLTLPSRDEQGLSWAGRSVPLDGVEDELGRAWRVGHAASGDAGDGPLTVRASVLNLTAVTDGLDDAARIAGALEQLGARHPSRTVIAVLRHDDDSDALDARVKTNLLPLPGTGRQLILEQISLIAGRRAARGIPPVVDRLLNSELPNFLWWLGEPLLRESPCVTMLAIADRLIVDSTCFRDLARTWSDLTDLANESSVAVSDCAWGQLGPWRELVAQFFDPPAHRVYLDTIARVSVTYEQDGAGRSGRAKALLLLGWLGSRLGWQLESAVPMDDAGCRVRFAAGDYRVEVALVAERSGQGGHDARRVTIVAGGEDTGVFQVARESPTALSTKVTLRGIPSPGRVTRAVAGDRMTCAIHGLNQFGRDLVFERALRLSADLARAVAEYLP